MKLKYLYLISSVFYFHLNLKYIQKSVEMEKHFQITAFLEKAPKIFFYTVIFNFFFELF